MSESIQPGVPSIEIEGLSYCYSPWPTAAKSWALKDIDLSIGSGEVVALIGANGSGKTTLVSTLLGLLAPTRGSIRVLGQDSRRLSPETFARVGYVSEAQDLPARFTLEHLIRFMRPLYPDWDDALCDELAEAFGIPRDQRVRTLSRGMRMRVRMVLAMAYRPEILIMDEPFGGLDPGVRQHMVEGALEATAHERWTVLLATHEMYLVEKLADRVACLDHGRLAFCEPLDSLLERHRRVEMRLTQEPATESLCEHWLDVQRHGRRLSFVDSRASGDRQGLFEGYASKIPHLETLDSVSMGLEEIFLVRQRAQQFGRAERGAA